MKITPAHYQQLQQAIEPKMKQYPRHTCPDHMTDKRYRWGLLWTSGVELDPLYQYLNDDHIDSALRRITGTT